MQILALGAAVAVERPHTFPACRSQRGGIPPAAAHSRGAIHLQRDGGILPAAAVHSQRRHIRAAARSRDGGGRLTVLRYYLRCCGTLGDGSGMYRVWCVSYSHLRGANKV